MLKDFIVELADEGLVGATLMVGHFGQHIPHHIFQPDAGEHAANAHRAGRLSVLNRVSFHEILTHEAFLIADKVSVSNGPFSHMLGDVVGMANSLCNDRQGEVFSDTGGELRTVTDELVRNVMGASVVAGVHFFVAQLLGAGIHDFEVVVAGQAGKVFGPNGIHGRPKTNFAWALCRFFCNR